MVPRCQLGELSPQIGDPQFATKIQAYLHQYGHITLGPICIVAPEHANAHPMVESWRNHKKNLKSLPADPLPNNVNNFSAIQLKFAFFKHYLKILYS
jgi:hypothetical protein